MSDVDILKSTRMMFTRCVPYPKPRGKYEPKLYLYEKSQTDQKDAFIHFMVTNSSAEEGCTATQESKSALVAPILMATPNP